MNQFSWRSYLLDLTHRWYWIAAFFLLGALLGWGVSRLTPPRYRASLDLYAGVDVYRGPRDRYIVGVAQDTFENLDDYKNWNMEQLSTLARQDDILVETLTRLKAEEDYWQSVLPTDLYTLLHTGWRNGGRWRLSADAPSPALASQAVRTWAEVTVAHVDEAVAHSRQLVALDARLVALADQLEKRKLRLEILQAARPQLESPQDVGRLYGLLARAAAWTPGWSALLESFPGFDAGEATIAAWLQDARSLVEADLSALPGEIDALEESYNALAAQYAAEADASQALSANLTVVVPQSAVPAVEDLRPAGAWMLAGGTLAVLAFLLLELVRASRLAE